MPRLQNILVANRGEIAVRVLRAARALGYRTTAVYSEADAHAPHVGLADCAVCLGPAPVRESYANIERVVAAARTAGADAVHPGYGMLSENAEFARACALAGLVFIGPRPETIELMGDKRRARLAMQAAGVACVPGYDGEAQDQDTLVREAARIGFPIMVKAAAGGGGRGMRRANAARELPEAITRARSEAEKSFGDGRLILERAIDGARHVEVQVLADAHGHVVHLGERDCSAQRRFQKVIEEAPSPAVDPALRERIGATAVRAAESCSYLGAGTVELLLEPGGSFFFLEMNTRLQVEHPVTELVTGVDLVKCQIEIAEGRSLGFAQRDVHMTGHAIEARLYAEDPERGFLPATGRVLALELPSGPGVRVDHGLCEGLVIGSHYDPMLAKVIAHGKDREDARRRLCGALRELRLLGVQTNQAFLGTVLEHERFVTGQLTTEFLDAWPAAKASPRAGADVLVAAALAFLARAHAQAPYPAELAELSNCAGLGWPLLLESGDRRFALRVEPSGRAGELSVQCGDERVLATLLHADATETAAILAGVRTHIDHAWDGERLWLHAVDGPRTFRDVTHAPPRADHARGGSDRALAPMDGAVVDVLVRVGDPVSRGQTLAVLAAMKLELPVLAAADGMVTAVHVARGDQVRARQPLVQLQPPDGRESPS
jgi:geranyl-CoA carboxylase alpha subunit